MAIRYRLVDLGNDDKLVRVRIVRRGRFDGFIVRWTATCSGCHESEDGHSIGSYPYDAKAQCELGAGCEECGYHGKVRRAEWVPLPEVVHAYMQWRDRVWRRLERLRAFWRKRAA